MTMVSPEDFPMTMEVEANMPPGCPPIGVAFGLYPLRDGAKSDIAGHDIFVDVIHVRIAIPGDTKQIYFQPAMEQHKKRFPQAWKAFQEREQNIARVEGMPIDQWAAVTRATALTLKAANIPTVEALAAVHDGNVDRIPNGRELRAKAIAFLKQSEGAAAIMKDAKEKKELQDQIEVLKATVAQLAAVAPDAESARKPSRKQAAA